tara:strand:+ start:630 stop:881 length:252 start_codon:yes stop_codon:yes gene_type:complete
MESSSIHEIVTIGIEGAAVLLLVVVAYKLYRLKVHSKSGCCGEAFLLETISRGASQRAEPGLEFTDMNKSKTPDKEDPDTAII